MDKEVGDKLVNPKMNKHFRYLESKKRKIDSFSPQYSNQIRDNIDRQQTPDRGGRGAGRTKRVPGKTGAGFIEYAGEGGLKVSDPIEMLLGRPVIGIDREYL